MVFFKIYASWRIIHSIKCLQESIEKQIFQKLHLIKIVDIIGTHFEKMNWSVGPFV